MYDGDGTLARKGVLKVRRKGTAWRIAIVSVALAALLSSTGAVAQSVSAQKPILDTVEHHWVRRVTGSPVRSTLTSDEREALARAKYALRVPPSGMAMQADKGYLFAQRVIQLMRSMRTRVPQIIGHEVVVWNDKRAVSMVVYSDGGIYVVGSGPVRSMLVSHAKRVGDDDDLDAAAVATRAFDVARSVDSRIGKATGALVRAHLVGFADSTRAHIVVRVGVDGSTSFPEY